VSSNSCDTVVKEQLPGKQTYFCICYISSLFNNTDNSSCCIVSNDTMINEQWMWKNMKFCMV
jgi:hypothetical protein